MSHTTETKTVLSEAIKLLGNQGGTIHQVKADILSMQPMDRGVFLNKLKDAIKEDDNLFRQYMTEYNPLRTDHIEIKRSAKDRRVIVDKYIIEYQG